MAKKPQPKDDEQILERMREALLECKSKWTLLSKQTGRALTYRWLTSFANGEIKEPSFQKICTLGKFLGIKVTTAPGRHFLKFEPEA